MWRAQQGSSLSHKVLLVIIIPADNTKNNSVQSKPCFPVTFSTPQKAGPAGKLHPSPSPSWFWALNWLISVPRPTLHQNGQTSISIRDVTYHSPVHRRREHRLPGGCISCHSSLLSLWWNHFVVLQMKMRAHTPIYKACNGIGKIFSLLSSDCILFGLCWFTIGINHLIRQGNSHSSVNQLMALP